MIGASDWGVFLDPRDFGETAHLDTQEGEFVDLVGIFEEAREVVLAGEHGGVSALMPVFTVPDHAMPETAAQGDDLEIRDRNYRVSDLQPDGSGMTRLILERT